MSITTAIRTDRARLVKVIHVARRELALDDTTYRLMLHTVTGKASTTDLSPQELRAVVQHLKKKGFKVRAASTGTPAAARPGPDRRQAAHPSARKVRALWLFLHQLGAVRDPSERALSAYCRRIAKVDDLHWADGERLDLLIETLKKWALRLLPLAIAKLSEQLVEVRDPARMPAALQALDSAHGCLARGSGFDMHWWAWETLSQAAGQVLPLELAELGSSPAATATA